MALVIRPFTAGQDEGAWVDIGNRAWAFDPEYVPATAEQFRVAQQAPSFNSEGMFMSELDGRPVGIVSGHVDKRDVKSKEGFLNGPYVLPESQRRGIGTALAERALRSLSERGMETVRSGVPDLSVSGQRFLEKLGFKQVRVFSRMSRSAQGLPIGIGESDEVEIRELGRSKEEARLLAEMTNDAFSEHFGHRDVRTEDEAFWMERAEEIGYWVRATVAYRNEAPVGFLIYGYSTKEHEHLGEKRAWLFSVGVLKPFRNQGVAKALMLSGVKDLAELGMEAIHLGVDDTNVTGALRLYERLGFKVFRKALAYQRRLTGL